MLAGRGAVRLVGAELWVLAANAVLARLVGASGVAFHLALPAGPASGAYGLHEGQLGSLYVGAGEGVLVGPGCGPRSTCCAVEPQTPDKRELEACPGDSDHAKHGRDTYHTEPFCANV
jgi:hypothetical protein